MVVSTPWSQRAILAEQTDRQALERVEALGARRERIGSAVEEGDRNNDGAGLVVEVSDEIVQASEALVWPTPGATTGGSVDHGKLIHWSVCFHTYSQSTTEAGF